MSQRGMGGARSWLIGLFVGLLAWSPGVTVLAQSSNKPPGSSVEQAAREREQERYRRSFVEQVNRELERARRQVETLYVLRLSETLALNPEQSARAAAVIRKAQEARRSLLDERNQILVELNALLSAGVGAEQIKPKVAQWEQNEARLGRWRQGLFQDLSRILSAEQQGRFVVFDENFNNEVRNAVMELRSGAPQGTKE